MLHEGRASSRAALRYQHATAERTWVAHALSDLAEACAPNTDRNRSHLTCRDAPRMPADVPWMCHIGTSLSDHRAVTRANSERATRIELAFSAWEAEQRRFRRTSADGSGRFSQLRWVV